MRDRVLIPLPDGRWLALEAEAFSEALEAGALAAQLPSNDYARDDEPLLDPEQMAAALSLPVTWIEQAARERRIPSIQAGRWRRFKRSEVERALTALSANGKHS
jgi:excisionase family DNA binding protein